MNIQEDEDAYLISTNYNEEYPLEGLGETEVSTGVIDENIHLFSDTYQSLSNLQNILKTKEKGDLFVMHFNASSVPKHFDRIESLMNKTNPDVLCITETRFNKDKVEYQIPMASHPNYKLIFDNAPTKSGVGGAAMYIRNCFSYSIKRELRLKVSCCESIFIELDLIHKANLGKTKSVMIGCVYQHPRPKKEQAEKFLEQLSNRIELYSDKNAPIVIMGDINIDINKTRSKKTKNYLNMLSSTGCCNLIEAHTHFEKKSRSTLDHIITNYDKSKITSGILCNPISKDHLPVYAILKCNSVPNTNKDEKENIVIRTWQKIDDSKKDLFVTELQHALSQIDLSEHPDKILYNLSKLTKSTIDKCFPPKKLSNRAKKRAEQPWVNKDLAIEKQRQNHLFRKFVQSQNPLDHKNYTVFRKKLSKKMKKRKKAYFRELIKEANSKKDFRKTWQAINRVLKRGKKELVCPKSVIRNGIPIKCKKQIANIMNKHFTSVGRKLADKLQNTDTNFTTFLHNACKKTFFLGDIELHEIIEEILGICITKAMGFDDIPPKVIKWAPHLFAPILLVLYNKCLHVGYYPSNMKIARVVPIHKEDDINNVSNYRPISILTQFNRIFERILAKRLMFFFEANNIISSKQFGFLKKHSTEHAILDLKEFIMENLNKQEISAVLFLDLQKAFDSVNHNILLKKLSHYGVRGIPLDLMTSYLSNRRQYTTVGGMKSDLDFVLWGVPQGSVLGPLLFILFINDLPKSSDMNTWLFADDSAMGLSSTSFGDLEVRFNYEVNKTQEWLLANKLSVHYTKKTKYILFIPPHKVKDKPPDFMLKMSGKIIAQTDKYKYLGLLFDEKLDWKPQIDKLCSKLSSVCGVISKVRHYLDRKSMMLIYNTLVESRLRYGLLGWSTASNQQLNRIRVLQNRALRFIDFSMIGTFMLPLYFHYKVLPLTQLIKLQQASHMYSHHYNQLPKVFRTYCSRPSHGYDTRYSKTNFNIS